MNKVKFCLFSFIIVTAACGEFNSSSDARRCADKFATAFVNYNFSEAQRYVTEESHKWLIFTLSSISDKDISEINNKEKATVEIEDVNLTDDGYANAIVKVNNWLKKDSIGTLPRIVDECYIQLNLEKQSNGKWLVRMVSPLQSERHYPD